MVGLVIVVNVINPNDYKSQIAKAAANSGYQVSLNGPLSWSFYPTLGFKINDVTIANQENATPALLQVKHSELSLKLFPLLTGNLQIKRIILDHPVINLVTNAQGKTNWQTTNSTPNATDSRTHTKSSKSSFDLNNFKIAQISIKNGQLNLINQQNHSNLSLNHFNFESRNIQNDSVFPVNLSFNLQQQPQFNFTVDLKTKIKLNLAQDTYQIEDLNLKVNNNNLSGVITDIKQKITFNLRADKIDASKLAPKTTTTATPTTTHPNTPTASDNKWKDQPLLPIDLLKSLNASGSLQIKQLDYAPYQLTNLVVGINAHQGNVTLKQLSANIFNGSLTANANINVQAATPKLSGALTIKQFRIEQILQDAMHKQPITGLTNYQTQLTTTGNTYNQWLQHLNGNGQFSIQNGQLNGINVDKMVNQGLSLIKGKKIAEEAGNKTSFTSLTASYQVKNGIASNQDLLLTAPFIGAKGQGQVNLPANQINYQLTTYLLQGQKANPEWQIPIAINGSLAAPQIQPDFAALTQNLIKHQAQKAINKEVNKLLKNVKLF